MPPNLTHQACQDHRGFGGGFVGGAPGFTIPNLERLELLDLSASSGAQLAARGTHLIGNAERSFIAVHPNTGYGNLKICPHSCADCMIILGRFPQLTGTITCIGRGYLAIVAGSQHAFRINLTMRAGGAAFFLGADCSANEVDFLVEGPGRSIQVGDDAMISYGVTVRTSDSHAIVDLSDRQQINLPSSILIQPHVWLGARSTVGKGLRVGKGAIVEECSVVTRPVPPCVVVTGAPAQIKRVNVTWTRDAFSSEKAIDKALSYLTDSCI
jgi:acetyltransferase-like isoleucine patch superfamily enzyme